MHCYFCQKNIKEIDFKDTASIAKFTSLAGKIKARKKTHLCAKHQRGFSMAIKRARFMGLLPYVKE